MTLSEIEREALALHADARARLVEVLLESLREAPLGKVDAAWDREIQARVAAYERGEAATFLAEDVFVEARRIAR